MRTSMAQVDLDSILDQRAYDTTKAERTKTSAAAGPTPHLDPTVSTLTFDVGSARVDLVKFERFLQDLLWEKSFRGGDGDDRESDSTSSTTVVLRAKGTLLTAHGSPRMLQAVQEVYELKDITSTKEGESLQTRLVLIGKNLHRKSLECALNACLV